ncbi:hypothetical protein TNIN_405241 [Trichonephila inaurata madagascariensis]|uniref:Transposase n=1 Tax=Trichonephila inaurata madagascariensis TaxID=2747483 RepID=A0A8X6XIE4_9ARAC|nr:hypothetical protein TNIN_405241 [Trichonephila inaurata madagascariensis]
MLRETFNRLGFETLEHLPYRPDLTPSDFHPFERKQMKSRRFASDRDARDAVQKWLQDQLKTYPIRKAFKSLWIARPSGLKVGTISKSILSIYCTPIFV